MDHEKYRKVHVTVRNEFIFLVPDHGESDEELKTLAGVEALNVGGIQYGQGELDTSWSDSVIVDAKIKGTVIV